MAAAEKVTGGHLVSRNVLRDRWLRGACIRGLFDDGGPGQRSQGAIHGWMGSVEVTTLGSPSEGYRVQRTEDAWTALLSALAAHPIVYQVGVL